MTDLYQIQNLNNQHQSSTPKLMTTNLADIPLSGFQNEQWGWGGMPQQQWNDSGGWGMQQPQQGMPNKVC